MCVDSTVESPTYLHSVPKAELSPQPPRRTLRARVSPRVAAHNTVSASTPGCVDRLPALHEALRHAGLWTWDTDHAADSQVCEGHTDVGELEAEVSLSLAADDGVRDDSHRLSIFSRL